MNSRGTICLLMYFLQSIMILVSLLYEVQITSCRLPIIVQRHEFSAKNKENVDCCCFIILYKRGGRLF